MKTKHPTDPKHPGIVRPDQLTIDAVVRAKSMFDVVSKNPALPPQVRFAAKSRMLHMQTAIDILRLVRFNKTLFE